MDLDYFRKYFKTHKATYTKQGDLVVLDWKKPETNILGIRYIFDGYNMSISGDLGSAVFRLTWKGQYLQTFKNVNLGYFYQKKEASSEKDYDFDEATAIDNLNYNKKEMVEELNKSINAVKEDWEYDIKELKDELAEFTEETKPSFGFDINEFDKDSMERQMEEIHRLSLESTLEDLLDEDEDVMYYRKKVEAYDELISVARSCGTVEDWVYKINYDYEDEANAIDSDYWEWLYEVGNKIPHRVELWLAGLKLAYEQLGDINE